MSIVDYPGLFIEDEIVQSSDPAKHADDIVANMLQHKIGWAVVNAAIGDNAFALRLLREASTRRNWGAHGVWAQNLLPGALMSTAMFWSASICIANIEGEAEERAWTGIDLDRLAVAFKDNAGVIFTQAAYDWPTPGDATTPAARLCASRWHARGITGIPEADLVRNPNATPDAMQLLLDQLQWPAANRMVAVYLDGKPAAAYARGDITTGRFTIFRYGDIETADWPTIDAWPRPSSNPPPDPPPEPDPLPKMSVMQGHANTRYGVQAVRNQIAPQTLGRVASLSLQDRLAKAAIDGKHTATKGEQIAALLDTLGYAKEGT